MESSLCKWETLRFVLGGKFVFVCGCRVRVGRHWPENSSAQTSRYSVGLRARRDASRPTALGRTPTISAVSGSQEAFRRQPILSRGNELSDRGTSIVKQGICPGTREMVEAAGVEPASETANSRELSCFSQVHLISSHALRTGEDVRATSLIDLIRAAQTEQCKTSLLCDAPYKPVGEA